MFKELGSWIVIFGRVSFDYKDCIYVCYIIMNMERMIWKMGVKIRGVLRIGMGGVIWLRLIFFEFYVGWII